MMPRCLLLASCWMLSLHGQEVLRGNSRCKCVDPWNLPHGGPPKNLTFVDVDTGRGCLKGEAGNCFPLDYGSKKCFLWDVNLAPRCADQEGRPLTNAPDSCKQPWCYVNSSCQLHSEKSMLFPGYELRYSYETCRAVDYFTTEMLVRTLKGKVLKAGRPNGNIDAWMIDFVQHLMNAVGVVVKPEDISSASLREFPKSRFTACAKDVALGLLDFCYGGFWETPERLAMTAFSPIYMTELHYLVVPGDGGPDLWQEIAKTFAPFSLGLWLVFLALALVVGFAMWLFGEVGNMPPISGVAMGLQLAALKFMGHGGGWESSRTRSGHFLMFGFSFLCMLGLASYTANLSSFLLMQNLHTGIKDINDAINSNVKICALQSSVGMLTASYPKLEPLVVPEANWGPMMHAFHAGACGALMMSPDQLEKAHAGMAPYDQHGSEGHCNLHRVGDTVLAIPVAIPINRDLDHALSYAWSREKYSGKMEHFQKQHPLPSSKCSAHGGLKEGATPMDVGDMLGGLIAVALFIVISLIMHIIRCGQVRFASHFVPQDEPVGRGSSTLSVVGSASTRVLRVAWQNPKTMTLAFVLFVTVFVVFSGLVVLAIVFRE